MALFTVFIQKMKYYTGYDPQEDELSDEQDSKRFKMNTILIQVSYLSHCSLLLLKLRRRVRSQRVQEILENEKNAIQQIGQKESSGQV